MKSKRPWIFFLNVSNNQLFAQATIETVLRSSCACILIGYAVQCEEIVQKQHTPPLFNAVDDQKDQLNANRKNCNEVQIGNRTG
jgi:hypothetical protein